MNEIMLFNSPEFGEVRTIEEDGKILFCATDIANALGYSNPRDAVLRHCRAVVKRDAPISGKMQEINYIPEGDVYRLIVSSKLPGAERFEHWVFDEVLPSIRRTGTYAAKKKKSDRSEQREHIQKGRLLIQMARICKEPRYQQILLSHAAHEITGEMILPLPAVQEKTFSAAEIGEQLGISAAKVGKIANKLGLKSEEYGIWVHDKSRYSNKEVESFRYFQIAVDKIKASM